jgi:hypothetical protein
MLWIALTWSLSCGPAAASSTVTLAVTVAPEISNAIASGALAEATAIWGAAGVTLLWHLSNQPSMAGKSSVVDVVFDDARGRVSGQDLPLGWITFDASGVPERSVHLSRRNAMQLVDATDAFRSRPTTYKELLAERALGRALAHELGHYLTGSKVHSPSGLMKGRRSADEFFSPARTGFTLNADERQLAARMLALTTAQTEAPEAAVDRCHVPGA